MNSSQIKYAKERAKRIKETRAQKIVNKYSKERRTLSDDEKIKALKAGRIIVVVPKGGYYRWSDAIKFIDEIPENVDARNNDLQKLEREYEKLIDELVLGDCDKALELLKKFESVK